MAELQKTDPRIRLGMLEEAERELLIQVQKEEEALRKILAELIATRGLLEEARGDLANTQQQHVLETQEEIDKQTQALEDMLATSVETRHHEKEDTIKQQNVVQYQTQTNMAADKIVMASSQQTIDTLMTLAYTDNWSQQQAQEFFTLQNTIKDTMSYDLNPHLKESVDQSYAALQTVQEKAQAQIKESYKSPDSMNPFDFTTGKLKDNYKH